MLSLTWACEKVYHFLVGLPQFKPITDNNPLVPLIKTIDLDYTFIRVQHVLIRLMRYYCICEHVPGKALVVAGALITNKTSIPTKPGTEPTLTDEVETYKENFTKI